MIMKKHYSQLAPCWHCPLLSLLTQRKTTNHNTSPTGGTRALTWSAATTRVSDLRFVTIPTEYEAFAKKDWFDFYGYVDLPVFFGGNTDAKGIWNNGSPLFMEIEPRFSIDKLTGTDLSFGPFKEWYFANNYIYDMGRNDSQEQSTWYMGLGTDIDTGLPMSLSLNVYAKYQWQNYGAANENEWDGYRFKVKYFVPITQLWGGNLSYIGFTNFDWGSDTGDNDFRDLNGKKARTNNSIASSHILALNYDHWHYSVVARYWHNGGQWNDDASLNFGNGDFSVRSTGWGGYLVVGYNF